MTSAIVPEIVNVEILEESSMTEAEEKELVIVKTAIRTAYGNRMEQDLAIGAGLSKIFNRKLYRGSNGGRTWEEWLDQESDEITAGRGKLKKMSAQRLRGFYRFRCEVLQQASSWSPDLMLPTTPSQVRPLLAQLEDYPEAAVEMWKAACADAGKGNVPTLDQVQRAALAYKANEANEARRLSVGQQAALDAANAAKRQAESDKYEVSDAKALPETDEPAPEPTLPGWTLQKDDSALDAIEECKEITRAINKAHEAVTLLRGILYKRISVHGRDYMGFLRQVDAGVYSLSTIDHEVRQIGEDVDFVLALLVADVGEGELSQTTVDLSAIPTRDG
jgi:hypothetical protein